MTTDCVVSIQTDKTNALYSVNMKISEKNKKKSAPKKSGKQQGLNKNKKIRIYCCCRFVSVHLVF